MGSDIFRFLLFLIAGLGLAVIAQLERTLLGQIHVGGILFPNAAAKLCQLFFIEDHQPCVGAAQLFQMLLRQIDENGKNHGRRS